MFLVPTGGPENHEQQDAAAQEQAANILGQRQVDRAHLFSAAVLFHHLAGVFAFGCDVIAVVRLAVM